MNYRHAYHAGNFADVFKHAVLARILVHLQQKAAAFRVIDTHAGEGLYDLSGEQARRTGEWRLGIARVADATMAAAVRALLAPYLEAVASFNSGGELRRYPGSPALALRLMRAQDRLIACELEPATAAALARNLRADQRAKCIAIDGWTALKAYIPPPERRGLAIVDPPFEQPDEFARIGAAALTSHRKWASGTFLLWYPIKDHNGPALLARTLRRSAIPNILRAELFVAGGEGAARLNGAGLVVINPPWRLDGEIRLLLEFFAPLLAQRDGAAGRATGSRRRRE